MFRRDILSWWFRPAFLQPVLAPFRRRHDTLFAGPWVGEFGWELMCWQGFVRKLASRYRRVVVACPRGREALYADFAGEIISHDLRGVSECNVMHDLKNPEELRRIMALIPRDADVLKPLGYQPFSRQTLIRFGKPKKELAFDILFHPRGRSFGVDRNWSLEKWLDLLGRMRDAGLKVGCLGVRAATLEITGDFTDWRDRPLAETLDIIASSRLVIGPSSGPMHLASLCGTPHVVWTDGGKYARGHTNRYKYESWWNPHGTPVQVLDDEAFDPSVEKVWGAVQRSLKTKNQVGGDA